MPTYLRIKPHSDFADYQIVLPEPATGDSVERIRTETWRYVERLSYFPTPPED